jgi:putative membrane protein
MDSATKHYSSMFQLPSSKKALPLVAVICIVGVSFCAYVFNPSVNSLFLGLAVFAITLSIDVLTSKIIMKGDPIFLLRRTVALSLVCWIVWFLFIAIGTALGFAFGGWLLWIKLSLLGYGALLTLRFLVFGSTSLSSRWRQIVAILLQPVLCIVPFVIFWANFSSPIVLQITPFIILAPIISYISIYVFLLQIDNLGKKAFNLPALPLFRAFLLNWVTTLNEPLEKHLEEMGTDSDIDVTFLKFDGAKTKAALIVPLVHPGPFKNIGSSLLPSTLKQEFDKEFNCNSAIPLGILGHELDLPSQAQNHKIISQIIATAKFDAQNSLASPIMRVTDGVAIASCQIFGDTAFLSFSLAPQTTEDLPQELGRLVEEEAKKLGVKTTIVVNAHNCLTDIIDTSEHIAELERAAVKCLQKAVQQQKQSFQVGAATVYPTEFTLKAGMGTGGITAIVVQVDKQKTAYVVIDGNNMIPHLREKILAALDGLGFGASEVFTTDTHAVSALVTGRRGYHPVGDVMDHDILIKHICDAAKKAEENLETCKAGSQHLMVPHVRVIGEERLKSVTTLVDKAIEKAKHTVAPIFGVEGLLLILLLLLF